MSDCPKSDDALPAGMWEERYQTGETGWDLGGPPPALVALIEDLGETGLRVLVPGAGRAHDAIAWARAGHHVTAVDYAPSAVAAAQANAAEAGVQLTVAEVDLFDLPASFIGAFDLVWEQTCYCAILPKQRDAYVAAMAQVLHPGGRFFGLLWNHGKPDGPPFDVTPEDVRERFPPAFEVVRTDPVRQSVPSRENEFLVEARRV